MNRIKSAVPALVLGAALMLLGPTAALAQRGGGGHGGHSGGGYSGRSFSGAMRFSGGAGRGFSGGGRSFVAPSTRAIRRLVAGAPLQAAIGGGYFVAEEAFFPGRFYAGRGYYYGGRFWARPYFGIGIGIPFGWGYNARRRLRLSMTGTETGCRLPAIRPCTRLLSPSHLQRAGSSTVRALRLSGSDFDAADPDLGAFRL